jgi:epoxyqueuosine reductase
VLDEVLDKLEAEGHKVAAVAIKRLEELRDHYEELARLRVIDEGIAQDLLRGLVFEPPESVPRAASLVVIATRDPVVHCTFEWQGASLTLPVPPTYLHFRRKSEEVTRELANLLPPGRQVACIMNAPQKLLAARSGLARYGRNNITYVPGLGSFYRLTTVCTDVPCDVGTWVDPSMMPRCEGCTRCLEACPTGAIPEDRTMLRAELCMTYWNEKPGDVPFPGWLADGWHNSLVGCLHCQLVCPENEAVLRHCDDGPRFTEDETRVLLGASGTDDVPEPLKQKLESWDLMAWLGVLPRNLAVHLPGVNRRLSG